MALNMKAILSMINEMVKELFNGLTEDSILDSGRKANNKGLASI